MRLQIRVLYMFSQIIDFILMFLYFEFLFQMQDRIFIESSDKILIYTPNLVDAFFILFVISFFIIYPLRNNKLSIGEKICKLKIENYKEVNIIQIIATNLVFWLSLGIITIRLLEFENIDFHSVTILIFSAIIYLLFLVLGIDLISLFGNNIKIEKG